MIHCSYVKQGLGSCSVSTEPQFSLEVESLCSDRFKSLVVSGVCRVISDCSESYLLVM